jgi:hypothetical protein
MGLKEHINEELKGDNKLPNAIKRRVTPDQLEEIFQYCIDDHIVDFRNPLSVSYPPSLEVYAKRIIHDIYYMLEYHTFKDGLIVDEEFYEEIIVPALYNYFIDRIEKVYNRFKGSLNESENKKTSLKEKLKNVVETQGIKMGVTIVGSLEKLFSILDIKGTQEDMIFLVKSIMDNEVEKQLKYCNYDIIKTLHSIKLYVFVGKPLSGEEETFDRLLNAVEGFISNLIYKLGGGLVRGHSIFVYSTGTNC